jgi:hypothetical protein
VRIDGTPGGALIANYYRFPHSLLHLCTPLHTSVLEIDSLRPSIPTFGAHRIPSSKMTLAMPHPSEGPHLASDHTQPPTQTFSTITEDIEKPTSGANPCIINKEQQQVAVQWAQAVQS